MTSVRRSSRLNAVSRDPRRRPRVPARPPAASPPRSRSWQRHQYSLRTRRTNRSDMQVQAQRDQEQEQPDEEEARIHGSAPAHLIGAGRERRDRGGHRLTALERVEIEERAAGATGDDRHDHRLADRPRHAEDDGGRDARDGRREHHTNARGATPGAETERRFTEPMRDGVHRVFGHRCDERRHEQPNGEPGREQVEERYRLTEELLHDIGADDPEREEPHHDAGDARERLEDRLQQTARARPREFREVERGTEPQRGGDEHRDPRHDDRAGDDRLDIELAESREPSLGPEARDLDLPQEVERPARKAQDDREADQDREEGRGEEQPPHRPLFPKPSRVTPKRLDRDPLRDHHLRHVVSSLMVRSRRSIRPPTPWTRSSARLARSADGRAMYWTSVTDLMPASLR